MIIKVRKKIFFYSFLIRQNNYIIIMVFSINLIETRLILVVVNMFLLLFVI